MPKSKKSPHQHWVHHLPEAGTITSRGHKQEFRLRHLADLKAEMKALIAEINEEEKNLVTTALHFQWTQEEIDTAQQHAREFVSVEAYRNHARHQYDQLQLLLAD